MIYRVTINEIEDQERFNKVFSDKFAGHEIKELPFTVTLPYDHMSRTAIAMLSCVAKSHVELVKEIESEIMTKEIADKAEAWFNEQSEDIKDMIELLIAGRRYLQSPEAVFESCGSKMPSKDKQEHNLSTNLLELEGRDWS